MNSQSRFYPVPDKFRVISGSALKTAAVITMLIDHIGSGLIMNMMSFGVYPFGLDAQTAYSFYRILRMIGRTAFPIYCFLLTEGLYYTKSKPVYLLRLTVFALISELPFDLALSAESASANTLNLTLLFADNIYIIRTKQNVYFTLAIGLAVIMCMDYFFGFVKKRMRKSIPLDVLLYLIAATLSIAALYAGCVIAEALDTDYGWIGIMLIAFLYLLRRMQAAACIFGYVFISNFNTSEIMAFPAFILMMLYNEKRGFIKTTALKYAFYAFYPVHLILIYLLRCVIL